MNDRRKKRILFMSSENKVYKTIISFFYCYINIFNLRSLYSYVKYSFFHDIIILIL